MMKVFNPSDEEKRNKEFILLLDKSEAVLLVDMAEAAALANPRKKNFKVIAKKLNEQLYCF